MDNEERKTFSEQNVRHRNDSSAISKIEKDKSKSPPDRRGMQSSVKEKCPGYPAQETRIRPDNKQTDESHMRREKQAESRYELIKEGKKRPTNQESRKTEDIKIVVSSYGEYTNMKKQLNNPNERPPQKGKEVVGSPNNGSSPTCVPSERYNVRENDGMHGISNSCQESVYYMDRNYETQRSREGEFVGLDSDLSKDQSRYTATPTEEWDEWTTNSEESSTNSFLHSEIVREPNTKESNVQPSASFDYLAAQKYEENVAKNSKCKDSRDARYEHDEGNYNYKTKDMNVYEPPLKPYPIDELYSNGRKNVYSKKEASESDTDLDNSYIFKSREGTMKYRRHEAGPQKDAQNELPDKDQYSQVRYRQTLPVMGNKEETYHKAKTSAIDTYLELHSRDKEPSMPAYSDKSPRKLKEPREYLMESRDTAEKRQFKDSRNKEEEYCLKKQEEEYCLKKQEADAKKESEAFIKSDVCSSLLSIKNRECPSTGSPKYSKHYVADLKKLTDTKSHENSYIGRLSTTRDTDEEAWHYHKDKKDVEPESAGFIKPYIEVTPYRPRGKEMKKTCEGIVSENAELLKSCYETSRSSTPIMPVTEGRETYLDKENISEKQNESEKGNKDMRNATQRLEEAAYFKYSEDQKKAAYSKMLADNQDVNAEERRTKDDKALSQNKNSTVQTLLGKDENPIPLFIEHQNSVSRESLKTEGETTLEEKQFESEFPSFSAYLKRTYGQTYQYRQRELEPEDGMTSGKSEVEGMTKQTNSDNDQDPRRKNKDKMDNEHRGPMEKKENCDRISVSREGIPRDQTHTNFEERTNFDKNNDYKLDADGYRYYPDTMRNQQTREKYSPRSNESISPRTQRQGQYKDIETEKVSSTQEKNTFAENISRKTHRNDDQSPQTQLKSEQQFIEPSTAEMRYKTDNGEKKNIESNTFLSRSKESIYETSGLAASSADSFSKQRTKFTKLTDHEDASPTISLLEKGFDSMLDMKAYSSKQEPRPNSPSPNRNHEEKFEETSRSRSRSRTKKKNVQSQANSQKQGHATHKSSPNIKISPTQFREKELGPAASQKMIYREKENYEVINRDLQGRNKHSNTDEQKLSDEYYIEDELTKFGKIDYFDREHVLHKSSPNLREIEQIYANVKPDNFVNLNNKYSETYPIGLNEQDMGLNRKHSHNKKDEMSENFRKIYVQNRVMDLKQEAMQRGSYLNSPKYESYSLDGEETQTHRKNVKTENKNTNNDSWFVDQEPLYPENYFVQRKLSTELNPNQNTVVSSPARSNTSSTDYCRSDPGKSQQVHHTAFIHESPRRVSVGTQMQYTPEDQQNDQQNPPKSRIRHKTLAYGVSGQDLGMQPTNLDADDDFKQRTYFCEADQQRGQVPPEPMDPNLDIEYKKLALVNDELLKMWEQAQAENTHLRLEMSHVKNENETLRHQLGSAAKQVSQINAMTDAEKQEKQIVVKKLAEMEEELKLLALSENLTDQTLDQLKSDNARLREENDALMRAMTSKQK